ncbi:MAG: DNA alkylation repair protein [Desulforegulaceae bacterium]|nr:DNA alkylation repair protein [Desulforegulaceae bacterium]
MSNFKKAQKEIRSLENKKMANHLKRFFKTQKGSYGEKDLFLGVKVPELRKIQKNFPLNLEETGLFLKSPFHEERYFALINLVNLYEKANKKEKSFIVNKIYLKNTEYINNWDLTDLSAPKITGNYFLKINYKNKDILKSMAFSNYLFDRRIAIVSTLYFIKHNYLDFPLEISKLLLKDEEDLINKAVGWILREVGKKDDRKLIEFLRNNYSNLKRVTLRYAIEKFKKNKRTDFLKGIF